MKKDNSTTNERPTIEPKRRTDKPAAPADDHNGKLLESLGQAISSPVLGAADPEEKKKPPPDPYPDD